MIGYFDDTESFECLAPLVGVTTCAQLLSDIFIERYGCAPNRVCIPSRLEPLINQDLERLLEPHAMRLYKRIGLRRFLKSILSMQIAWDAPTLAVEFKHDVIPDNVQENVYSFLARVNGQILGMSDPHGWASAFEHSYLQEPRKLLFMA